MNYLEPCIRIWNGYKTFAKGGSVIRKGFELVAAADLEDDSLDVKSTFTRRSESVLEHDAQVAWLATAFASNFPRYFGEEVREMMSLNMWMNLVVAIIHDVGETARGDIPDDGRREHETKDIEELEVLKTLLMAYSPRDRDRILRFVEHFLVKDTY